MRVAAFLKEHVSEIDGYEISNVFYSDFRLDAWVDIASPAAILATVTTRSIHLRKTKVGWKILISD
jgi:hypothetical protein